MTTPEILTPQSPRWREFIDGMTFMMTKGCAADEWRCDGDGTGGSNLEFVHCYAKTMMRNMGNVDVEGTLAYCKEHCGYCDCEILFNVDPEMRANRDE